MEITTGFLMFWGGIAGAVATVVGAVIYFNSVSRKAKKLLRDISKEDF